MSIDFWTPENFNTFWGYVKMLLETIQPGVMLVVAIATAGLLLGIIVRIYKEASKKEVERRTDDNGEDYEIRRY